MAWSLPVSKSRGSGNVSCCCAGPTLSGEAVSSPAETRPKQLKEAHLREIQFLMEASWRSLQCSRSKMILIPQGYSHVGFILMLLTQEEELKPLMYPESEEKKRPPPSTANNIGCHLCIVDTFNTTRFWAIF